MGVVTHGLTNHRLYSRWLSMRNRCENPKDDGYVNYGGRGIKVCERWKNVALFVEDMGDSFQEGLSLERVNNNGDYEPSNCKWATKSEQSRNRRITWKGIKHAPRRKRTLEE